MSNLFYVLSSTRFEGEATKGSRFIADVHPVVDRQDAKTKVAALRAEFPNASHHCWAWRLPDGSEQSSDDGEPGGSAGRPILAQIVGHQVVGVLVVVTRWFGGTKLGVGGLVRAYGGAAGKALDRAAMEPFIRKIELCVEHSYADGPAVDAALNAHGAEVTQADYGAVVWRRFHLPLAQRAEFNHRLRDATSGRVSAAEAASSA